LKVGQSLIPASLDPPQSFVKVLSGHGIILAGLSLTDSSYLITLTLKSVPEPSAVSLRAPQRPCPADLQPTVRSTGTNVPVEFRSRPTVMWLTPVSTAIARLDLLAFFARTGWH
jgi:hypothetical protein